MNEQIPPDNSKAAVGQSALNVELAANACSVDGKYLFGTGPKTYDCSQLGEKNTCENLWPCRYKVANSER